MDDDALDFSSEDEDSDCSLVNTWLENEIEEEAVKTAFNEPRAPSVQETATDSGGSMRTFEITSGEDSAIVTLTNVVASFHVTVADEYGGQWPCQVHVKNIVELTRGKVHFVQQQDRFRSAVMTTEWRNMFRGLKNLMNSRGHVVCPGAHCKNETYYNMILLCCLLTRATGVPVRPLGRMITNHVCAFRCGFKINLASLRIAVRILYQSYDPKKQLFQSERIWPYNNLPEEDPRHNILIMIFEHGAVTCTGMRREEDFVSTCTLALSICIKHKEDSRALSLVHDKGSKQLLSLHKYLTN